MGCVVNGPGEAREADLGVASGNGKGQIFVKGEVIKTVPESQIVETLIEEAMRLADAMRDAGGSAANRRSRCPDPRGSGTGRAAWHCVHSCHRDCRGSPYADRQLAARTLGPGHAAQVVPGAGRRSGLLLHGGRPVRAGRDERGRDGRPVLGRSAAAATGCCSPAPRWCRWPATPSAMRSFAHVAARRGRKCATILGPAELVLPLWERLEPRWGPARDVRADQPLMACPRRSARSARPAGPAGPAGRAGAVLPGGGRDVHRGGRRRPAGGRQRPWLPGPDRRADRARRAFARFDGETVMFKAEIGSLSPHASR